MIQISSFSGLDEIVATYSELCPGKRSVTSPSGRPFRLSRSAFILLHAAYHRVSLEDLARQLNDGTPHTAVQVCAEDLQHSLELLLVNLAHAESSPRPPLTWGFWGKFTLVPRFRVSSIAQQVRVLLSWQCAVVVAATAIILFGWTSFPSTSLSAISLSTYFEAYGLLLLSSFIHEFGHASVAAKYGAAPSDIGFVFYLNCPAFYSDVSSVWQLERIPRVLVGLGGVYFQIVVADIYLILFRLEHSACYYVATYFIALSVLLSLNPLFRCDGYWILSDLLKTERLDRKPLQMLRLLLPWQRSATWRAPSSPVEWVVAAYSLLSLSVWCLVLVKIIPTVLREIMHCSRLVHALAHDLFAFHVMRFVQIEALVAALVFVLPSSVALYRLCKAVTLAVIQNQESSVNR